MTQYLISFDEGAMRVSEEDLPAVTEATVAVVRAAMDAGAWVFGGGLTPRDGTSVVSTDGTIADAPDPASKQYLGGFSIVDVPTREEALQWAAKLAVACRCAQEVRELLPAPPDL
ncbi:YciI family protein [Amycolatopsis sp. NPDC089917]|uniref:YciI family protein n=1 Tax=Amycolatopsis sp. NPDC089917 TaxID=3155187 RepID=UPI00343222CD